MDKPYLTFSKDVFDSLMELKEWNYKYIYDSKEATKHEDIMKEAFNKLFYIYYEKVKNIDIEVTIESEEVLYRFVRHRLEDTRTNSEADIKRAVIDYIAGETDSFFLNECEKYIEGFDSNNLYK